MVSHKHKCIFVHIPKVAGISIETLFLNDLGMNFYSRAPLLLRKNEVPEIGPPRLAHLTAKEYVHYNYVSQEIFESYFKFSFVRNPYDRVYSMYKYLGYRYCISFKTFVLKHLERLIYEDKDKWFFKPQHAFIYDEENSKMLVEFVGKLEKLQNDFDKISNNFNLKENKIPHINKSDKKTRLRKIKYALNIFYNHPYLLKKLSIKKSASLDFYTEEMAEKVFKLYDLDFKLFDYKPNTYKVRK